MVVEVVNDLYSLRLNDEFVFVCYYTNKILTKYINEGRAKFARVISDENVNNRNKVVMTMDSFMYNSIGYGSLAKKLRKLNKKKAKTSTL